MVVMGAKCEVILDPLRLLRPRFRQSFDRIALAKLSANSVRGYSAHE